MWYRKNTGHRIPFTEVPTVQVHQPHRSEGVGGVNDWRSTDWAPHYTWPPNKQTYPGHIRQLYWHRQRWEHVVQGWSPLNEWDMILTTWCWHTILRLQWYLYYTTGYHALVMMSNDELMVGPGWHEHKQYLHHGSLHYCPGHINQAKAE